MATLSHPTPSAHLTRLLPTTPTGLHKSPMKHHGNPTPTASKAKKTIRLLIVDDHPVVRKGIAASLASHPHIQIVGEAADGVQALRMAHELVPDIMLTDIDLPEKNGLVVTETIRKEIPSIRVLILSMHTNTDYVLRIVQSGASGYILKGGSTEDLLHAIEIVHAGEAFFSPEVARTALNQFVRGSSNGGTLSHLTTREREVLIQIAAGLSNKEIAGQLGVGVRTVETHRERIMKKLSIRGVAGLTKFALAQGLITLQP